MAASPPATPKFGHSLSRDFLFPDKFVNLNHGSFGAIPKPVLSARQTLHVQSEQYPDHFMRYHSISLLDEARVAIAKVINIPVEEVVFVTNATSGVNTVLRGLTWEDGDVIMHFGTIYGACGRTVQYIADTTAATCVVIPLVYPVSDAAIVESFNKTCAEIRKAGKKPKLVIFDTVSSMPGMRFPWEAMVVAAKENEVLSLIDGAHGVGNIKLDLTANKPDFFVSNCHKWLFTPRPAAILHVPLRNQHLVPTSIPTSHYYLPKSAQHFFSPLTHPGAKSNFTLQFEFNGTIDMTPYLCVPTALKYRQQIGGEDAIIEYCHTLAYEGGAEVAKILGTEIMLPDASGPDRGRCTMVNIRLPLLSIPEKEVTAVYNGFTKDLGEREKTFVQVYVHGGKWWVRLSAQVYLEMEDFVWIAGVLKEECWKVNERVRGSGGAARVNGADVHAVGGGGGAVEEGLGDLRVTESEGESVQVKG
ncbi:hypothetical protein ABW19_dt0201432 [Dactylella cylindrospora]|nr:hypothetical protein ABW19_dt0201432 [Dactylella cylindrospora]